MPLSKIENSRPEIVSGAQRTFIDITSALIRELPIRNVTLSSDGITRGLIPDLRGPSSPYHSFAAKINFNPLTGEFGEIDPRLVIIDGHKIRRIDDLILLGLSPKQINILKNNAEIFGLLNRVQRDFRRLKPAIMKVLDEAFNTSIEHHYGKPGNIFNILANIHQAEAFILADSLGNRQGPYGNPLGTTMVGKNCGEFHPTFVGSEQGSILVPFIKTSKPMKISGGQTDSPGRAGQLLRDGYIPMHPFNFANFSSGGAILDVQYVPCFVLMSKRSMIPVGETIQIKMSFGVNITTRDRTIHFQETENAIKNSEVLHKLAQKNVLPSDLWVMADELSGQVEDNDNTTFLVRSAFEDVFANAEKGKRLPESVFPVTAASLMSENMLSPKPLLVDFAEAGVDPLQLGKDIIEKMVTTAFDFMEVGLIPEMHPQNHIYLIDKNTKRLGGLIIRDNEGIKINVERLKKKLNIYYDGIYMPAIHATSRIENDLLFRDSFTKYFDRFIITGTITPLILALHKHFGVDIEELIKFTKEIYIGWWKSHNKTYSDYKKSISPEFFYANRGLFCLEVNARDYPLMTRRPTHPLVPTHEEMEAMLSPK